MSGNVTISTGNSTHGRSGQVNIEVGRSTFGNGSTVAISAGATTSVDSFAGEISIVGGIYCVISPPYEHLSRDPDPVLCFRTCIDTPLNWRPCTYEGR
jgi:hypothetical protein